MGHEDVVIFEVELELPDLRSDLDPEMSIEVGQRLIQQQHDRLLDERPCQGHALPLAAGELMGSAAPAALPRRTTPPIFSTSALRRVRRTFATRRAGSGCSRGPSYAGRSRSPGRRIRCRVAGRQAGDVDAVEQDAPGLRRDETADEAEGGRLAASRRAHEATSSPSATVRSRSWTARLRPYSTVRPSMLASPHRLIPASPRSGRRHG